MQDALGSRPSGVPAWAKVAGPPLAALALVVVLFLIARDGGDADPPAASTDRGTEVTTVTSSPAAAGVDGDDDEGEPAAVDDGDDLPPVAASGSCPTIAEDRQDEEMDVIARYGTSRFFVWICEGSGGLTYHGQQRGGDPEVDSLTLDASTSSTGYVAMNGVIRYEVDPDALRVTNGAGERILDLPVLAHEES